MLNAHVLVLNKSWVAINVATARRALCLLYQGHARVVHPEDYALYDFDSWCVYSQNGGRRNGHRIIRTSSMEIRLPEVIQLSFFNGFVRHEIQFSRRNIFVRDKNQCQYCGMKPPKNELSIDHVVPRSRGGQDHWDNLVLACKPCNSRKGDRTPEEARMKLLRKPKTPQWLPRFGHPVPPDELGTWQRFVDTAYWSAGA